MPTKNRETGPSRLSEAFFRNHPLRQIHAQEGLLTLPEQTRVTLADDSESDEQPTR